MDQRPLFNRDHYYSRWYAETCDCNICLHINNGYNRLDKDRYNHIYNLHRSQRTSQLPRYRAPNLDRAILPGPRRLTIRQYPDPTVNRRVFFSSRASHSRGL